jgi:hypothetical protein
MARLFDQRFCLPYRGDGGGCGEVFAALYMLLCGDVLRHQRDRYMRLFEVDLEEWLVELQGEIPETLKTPNRPAPLGEKEDAEVQRASQLKADDKARETLDSTVSTTTLEPNMEIDKGSMTSPDSSSCCLTLNFIQVCHNYFRSHAWFGQSMLEYMYSSATGCYVYPLCPAIDIVFPIKQVNATGMICYHPCLVSVKCWDSITQSDMESALTSMGDYLQAHRPNDVKSTSALCLLIVIGTYSIPETFVLPQKVGSFPNTDSRLLCHRGISLESMRPLEICRWRPISRSC